MEYAHRDLDEGMMLAALAVLESLQAFPIKLHEDGLVLCDTDGTGSLSFQPSHILPSGIGDLAFPALFEIAIQ